MREIELVRYEDVPQRVDNIKKSFESIYEVELGVGFENVALDRLHPTEGLLEKDKLALIIMKTLMEGYNAPIITVRHFDDYFIVDGHHRSFIRKKLRQKTIESYILEFPETKRYKERPIIQLEELSIMDVAPIDDPLVKTWAQVLTLLKYYETLHNTRFWLANEDAPLKDLVPTQIQVRRK